MQNRVRGKESRVEQVVASYIFSIGRMHSVTVIGEMIGLLSHTASHTIPSLHLSGCTSMNDPWIGPTVDTAASTSQLFRAYMSPLPRHTYTA